MMMDYYLRGQLVGGWGHQFGGGDVGDKMVCKGMGGEKDQLVVVEDGGNGGGSGEKGVWSMRGVRGVDLLPVQVIILTVVDF